MGVAVRLARRWGTRCSSCTRFRSVPKSCAASRSPSSCAAVEHRLERAVQSLQDQGVQVTAHVAAGAPDDALLEVAAQLHAQLVVVGALGHRMKAACGSAVTPIGSRSVRTCRSSSCATLRRSTMARTAAAVAGGARRRSVPQHRRGDGADRAHAELAPCDVTAIHLYWPPQQFERLGLEGVRTISIRSAGHEDSVRDLTIASRRRESGTRSGSKHIRISAGAATACDLATERKADLLVVGSHDRSRLGRLWEGTVSRCGAARVETSVLCVPLQPHAAETMLPVPQVRNVLVATNSRRPATPRSRWRMRVAPPARRCTSRTWSGAHSASAHAARRAARSSKRRKRPAPDRDPRPTVCARPARRAAEHASPRLRVQRARRRDLPTAARVEADLVCVVIAADRCRCDCAARIGRERRARARRGGCGVGACSARVMELDSTEPPPSRARLLATFERRRPSGPRRWRWSRIRWPARTRARGSAISCSRSASSSLRSCRRCICWLRRRCVWAGGPAAISCRRC